MNTEISLIINTVKKELWFRWKLSLFVFFFTAITILGAAWFWPKIYTSSSVILVDQQSILSPLMRGTAAVTEVRDRSRIAEQVVFSQRSMEQVIASEFWAGEGWQELTAREFEQLVNEIQGKANVTSAGKNLIEISYKDSNAEKAFETASLLTEIFIQESKNAKQQESRGAYEFIDQQASIYQGKLRSAETAIKEFRSKNIDATQSAKDNANIRLIELKRELETTELEISTTKSRILGSKKRLSGEVSAETGASFTKETQIQARITDLNTRLGDLRLNYKETYPDIIQLKGQIKALQNLFSAEANKREEWAKSDKNNIPTGAVAQELKQAVLMAEANLIGLVGKRNQLKKLTDSERTTLAQINAVEAEVAELNRDYTVNQNMYQDLLAQRENARVSMNMDINNQGLTMKIQEPAQLAVTPKGLLFSHIALAGLFLSFAIPIALVWGLTLIDQKVRSEIYLRDELRLPILAAVYPLKSAADIRSRMIQMASIGVVILSAWSIYGYVIVLRIQG